MTAFATTAKIDSAPISISTISEMLSTLTAQPGSIFTIASTPFTITSTINPFRYLFDDSTAILFDDSTEVTYA